jgi:hypothetical protein
VMTRHAHALAIMAPSQHVDEHTQTSAIEKQKHRRFIAGWSSPTHLYDSRIVRRVCVLLVFFARRAAMLALLIVSMQ